MPEDSVESSVFEFVESGERWGKEFSPDRMSASTSGALSIRTTPKHSRSFLAVFAVFVVVSVVGLSGVFVAIAKVRVQDWIAYWAAGHQLVRHINPYDSQVIQKLEISQGLHAATHVLMARNPPFALYFMAPLGHLNAQTASILWRLLLASCLALSCHLIWTLLGRPSGGWYRIGYVFAPALSCVAMGQTSILALLGLLLFFDLHQKQPFVAGIALSLCAIKPHLFLPFVVALLGWIVTRQAYRLLAGAAVALIAESLFPLYFDHSVWSHYRMMIRTDGIEGQFTPTIGVAIRFLLNRHAMWLEFIPVAAGCVWAAWYFYRNRESWNWLTQGALLMMVALTVTPYAWLPDYVLLLPFIISLVYRCSETALTVLLALMSVATIQFLLGVELYSPWYLWQTVAWLGWYLYALRVSTQPRGQLKAELA